MQRHFKSDMSPVGNGKPRFDKSSEGQKKLHELIANGKITFDMKPSEAYAQDNVFLKYDPTAFRGCYNKLRSKGSSFLRRDGTVHPNAATGEGETKPPPMAASSKYSLFLLCVF
jgi:hypothetical protein